MILEKKHTTKFHDNTVIGGWCKRTRSWKLWGSIARPQSVVSSHSSAEMKWAGQNQLYPAPQPKDTSFLPLPVVGSTTPPVLVFALLLVTFGPYGNMRRPAKALGPLGLRQETKKSQVHTTVDHNGIARRQFPQVSIAMLLQLRNELNTADMLLSHIGSAHKLSLLVVLWGLEGSPREVFVFFLSNHVHLITSVYRIKCFDGL